MLARFIKEVIESIEALQGAVKILSLGIEYHKYVKFGLLTPEVWRRGEGDYKIIRVPRGSKGIPTAQEVRFCINFVIEAAITLQEFDFNVEEYR